MCDIVKSEEDMLSHNKIRWTVCTAVAALLILFSSITQVGNFSSMMQETNNFKQNDYKYVIVFDGGSTGTRMHIFFFLNDSSGHVTLDDEYFQEVKPGLSSFAAKPRKAAKSIVHLLEKAEIVVPKSHWGETPVTLKATAGLRLLPIHISDSILNEVTNVISSSPFLSSNESVSVMNGEDEGLFAWYTINFLLGNIENPGNSVATLDLGGGSTQVTFAPLRMQTMVLSPEGYVLNKKIQNKPTTIYSHSYLGLGLMAARLAILKLDNEKDDNNKENVLRSVCFHPQTEVLWHHGTETFLVMGKGGNYGFDQCYEKAVSFLNSTIHNPEELWTREVYGVSYYFDKALDLGIISEDGGTVTVGQYMLAANNACSNKEKDPFLCLDATYIAALFHHGLEFNKNTEIKLVKQINGIETSWGLGAAFNMLS